MTILSLTYRERLLFFKYLIFKDYSIFCIDIYIYIYILYHFKIFSILNSIITCYVCVQLTKIIYIYIYIFTCICFVSNIFLLKVLFDLLKTVTFCVVYIYIYMYVGMYLRYVYIFLILIMSIIPTLYFFVYFFI